MHGRKFMSEARYLTGHGEARVKARKEMDDNTIISSRSQMIEVCSESSFQPLLQLYLFLPTLLISFQGISSILDTTQSAKDMFGGVVKLQFWSILTSCISLAWSFTTYQSTKKNGALSIGSNLPGFLCMLFSNILQISTRLIVFVLLAYSFGDGNFWPAFVIVLVHIVCLAFFSYDSKKPKWMMAIYQAHINGISNLYMHSLILPLPGVEKNKKRKNNQSLDRQVVVDSILMAENLMVIVASFFLIPDLPSILLMFIFFGQIFALLLKGAYYNFFHIWSSILTCQRPGPCAPCATKEEEEEVETRELLIVSE